MLTSITGGFRSHKQHLWFGGLTFPPCRVILCSYQPTQPMRIEVRYQTPYNQTEWRSQWFPTLDEAERMVDFYRSCGSPSHIAPSSLAQFEYLPEYRRNHLA